MLSCVILFIVFCFMELNGELWNEVNSLRSWKLKRTIVWAAEYGDVQHEVLNFHFNFFLLLPF